MIARKLSACMLVVLLTVSAFAIASYGARANQGGQDTYGYYWTDSNYPTPSVTYDWIDITGTGTDTGLYGDDGYAGPLPIGFPFEFYGNTYEMFNVSTNGLLQFGGGSSDWTNDPIPSSSTPNNIVAVCWDDLVSYSGYSSILYQTFGASPNQYLVVEFYNVYTLSYGYILTFEAVLYETGEIVIQYQYVDNWYGQGASIGIEDSTGTLGSQYSYNQYVLSDELAIMFDYSPIIFTPYSVQTVSWGGTAMHTLTIGNTQAITDSFDINWTSYHGWPVTVLDSTMTPLVDSNGNSVVDTGDLLAGESTTLYVQVEVDATPDAADDVTQVWAISYADPSISRIAVAHTFTMEAQFGTSHYDYGVDTDSDYDFDYLNVELAVDVIVDTGLYVDAYLFDSSDSYVTSTWDYYEVSPGSTYLTAVFSGEDIFAHGYDGMFYVDATLLDDVGNPLDYLYDYETEFYYYTDFDPPAACFEGPHADSAVDDGDWNSQYDYLVISAEVAVYEAGEYIIYGELYDESFWVYITYVEMETGYLDVGLHTVDVVIPSLYINISGVDGPYGFNMYLYTITIDWLDTDAHITAAYMSDDFEGPRAQFVTPFGEMTEDTDSDTLYNSVVVTAYIECFETGLYDLEVWVYDPWGYEFLMSYQTVSLTEGMTTGYNIVLDSNEISLRQRSGYYDIYLTVYTNSSLAYQDWEFYETDYYDYTSFDPFMALIQAAEDAGRDTDDDTLYNEIVINVTIEAQATGDFALLAYVYDMYYYSFLLEDQENVSLTEGDTYYWEIVVPGEDFLLLGVDTYLYLDLYTADAEEEYYLDYEYYYTSIYYMEDFDRIGAFFGNITEEALDTDSDGDYNGIYVSVTVEPASTGDYNLYASIYTYYSWWMEVYEEDLHLVEGVPYYWEFELPGDEIYLEWLEAPFYIELYTYDDTWSYNYDYAYLTTADYYQGDFDVIYAEFYSVSDAPLDTDDDGLYNEIIITALVDPWASGEYLLMAEIRDYYYGYMMTVEEFVYLEEGELFAWEIVITNEEFILQGVSGYMYVYLDIYYEGYYWMDDYTHYTNSYYISDFDPIGAFFVPPYDEYTLDEDLDMKYDSLNVVLYIEAASDGYFDVYVYIEDPWGYYYTDLWFGFYLEEGETAEMLVQIPSTAVSYFGHDGQWWLGMEVYGHYSGYNYDYDSYYTNYYYVDDFEVSPVQFEPPHTDYGLDTNNDTYYDYFVLEVQLDCYAAGTYTIYAELYEYYGSHIADIEVSQYLTYGNNVVTIYFEGWLIYNEGTTDYLMVYLEVVDSEGAFLDEDTHITDYYYYYWDFAYPPAYLDPPHSDYAVDDDSDSLYEYLVVNVTLDVVIAGEYIVEGRLVDDWGYYVATDRAQGYFEPGVNSTLLWYDAWPIWVSYSYPYYVSLSLYDADGNLVDNGIHYMTAYYPQGDFDPTPPTIESGWAYEAPTIDGAVDPDEWFGATVVDLMDADLMNRLPTNMLVMNDDEMLYVLVDVTGDLTESDGDTAAVAFDTDNDEMESDGGEDQFVIEATSGSLTYTTHLVFDDWYWYWEIDCAPFDPLLPDHEGLAGASGFGPSPALTTAHRIYEFSIPLALLDVMPGDDIGFAGLSDYAPLATDGETYDYSTWPVYVDSPPPLYMYGDLLLAEEPPLTMAILTGDMGEAGWFLSDVGVTLTTTNGTYGVANTTYNLDDEGWQTYSDAFMIEGDGTHTLEFYSIDVSGNSEPVRTLLVRIDTVAPETTSAELNGTEGLAGWFVTEATVTFEAEDDTSGLSAIMYRVDDGDWTALSGLVLTISEDGDHTVEYYALDVAGNEEDVTTISVKVDTGAPATDVSVDGYTVTLSASDGDGSGVAVTMYRIDGGDWIVYDGEFVVKGSGTHTLEYYSVDLAGNTETVKSVSVEGKAGILGGALVWAVVIAAIAAVALIALFFLMKRRPKQPTTLVPGEAVVEQPVVEEPPPPPA